MSPINKLTTPELVERFTAIALEQDNAIREFDSPKFNRLHVQMDAIREELKGRDGDQRPALMPLYHHPNGQVRLKAAITTLALAPKAARAVISAIANAEFSLQTADARHILEGLDEGDYKPT